MRHPLLDAEAARGRLLVPSVQGKNGLYFAGAWTGFGFHEDGLKSAHVVADLIAGGSTNAVTVRLLVDQH
jgi:predicted NAD/FAD-binding protein